MSTSLNINNYEPWWRDNVFVDADKTKVIRCSSQREAQAIRLKGYGFLRALRAWLADPMTPDVVKEPWLNCIRNSELKEMLIRNEGGQWVVKIQPRVQLMPVIVEEETDMSKVLPIVAARVQDEKDVAEAQEEYDRRKMEGTLPKPVDPLQEFLNNMGSSKFKQGE